MDLGTRIFAKVLLQTLSYAWLINPLQFARREIEMGCVTRKSQHGKSLLMMPTGVTNSQKQFALIDGIFGNRKTVSGPTDTQYQQRAWFPAKNTNLIIRSRATLRNPTRSLPYSFWRWNCFPSSSLSPRRL